MTNSEVGKKKPRHEKANEQTSQTQYELILVSVLLPLSYVSLSNKQARHKRT